MSSVTRETEHEHRMDFDDVRKQVLTFGNQLHEYFDKVQADVQNYKFTVEKHGDGVEVEIQLKAYVHPKGNEAVNIIPK
jgi:RNA binding exosome subunit